MRRAFKILFTCFVFTFTFNSIKAQTLDEIVKKHVEAVGGNENWGKIKTMKMECSLKAQGADIKFVIAYVDKKSMRQDISAMGMTGYSILNTTEGCNFMPWQGHTKPEAMTADDVKNSKDELYIQDEFITYKELGKKIEYFGKDDIDGTECFKIKMTDPQGKETTYYLDPSNYYVIKETEKVKANGQEVENSTFYSDYKKLDEGIVYPMGITGGWGEMTVTKLELNPKIDESIFKIPK